jgi:hypothetical protein
MTPSITENPGGSKNISKKDSQSSFSLSEDEMGTTPKFLEESKFKKQSTVNLNTKLEKALSLKDIRNKLKYSLEQQKQIFNSVKNPKNEIQSSYAKEEDPRMKQESHLTKLDSDLSRHSSSKVEYKHFKRHEFFEEKVKMQREKVRFMIEDDPESDKKVIFKNNHSYVKVFVRLL